MWFLLLVSFTHPELPPVGVAGARFTTNDACQIKAAAANKQTLNGLVTGEMQRPEGAVFVCVRMVAPT